MSKRYHRAHNRDLDWATYAVLAWIVLGLLAGTVYALWVLFA